MLKRYKNMIYNKVEESGFVDNLDVLLHFPSNLKSQEEVDIYLKECRKRKYKWQDARHITNMIIRARKRNALILLKLKLRKYLVTKKLRKYIILCNIIQNGCWPCLNIEEYIDLLINDNVHQILDANSYSDVNSFYPSCFTFNKIDDN